MTGLISKEQISKKAFTYEINGKQFPKVVFLSDINKADEVDAAPIVHGHWDSDAGFDRCSICGGLELGQTEYCPHCGAKMR